MLIKRRQTQKCLENFKALLRHEAFCHVITLGKIDLVYNWCLGFPGGTVIKNPPANAGDMGSIPGSGRSPEEGNGDPLQYSCLGNPLDRRAWHATVHGLQKSQTQLSD